MSEPAAIAGTPVPPKGSPLAAGKDAGWWTAELRRSAKSWKDYRDRAKKVVERYRDERDQADGLMTGTKKFAILYSNTETLGPAIYSQVPQPDIRRRWQDKDPVARVSATVLQRATQYCVESYDFNSVLDACKLDYLLPGFAVARAKYKPYINRQAKKDEQGNAVMGDDKQPAYDESLVWQEAGSEYVPWDCFLMSRSKTYERVWWVAFGDDLTRDEAEQQFGVDVASKLQYGRKQEPGETEDMEQTARVWEVWCKRGVAGSWWPKACRSGSRIPRLIPCAWSSSSPTPAPSGPSPPTRR
jgi:hypothetical protein